MGGSLNKIISIRRIAIIIMSVSAVYVLVYSLVKWNVITDSEKEIIILGRNFEFSEAVLDVQYISSCESPQAQRLFEKEPKKYSKEIDGFKRMKNNHILYIEMSDKAVAELKRIKRQSYKSVIFKNTYLKILTEVRDQSCETGYLLKYIELRYDRQSFLNKKRLFWPSEKPRLRLMSFVLIQSLK